MPRTVTIEKTVYKYDELSEKAKENALNEHIKVMLETGFCMDTENAKKAIEHCERLQTPWFLGGYIFDYCKEEILDNIRTNNDEFDENGNIQ